MKNIIILLSITGLFATGCSNAEPLVKASEDYATAVCACADMACAATAAKGYADEVKELTEKKMTPNKDEAKKMTDAAKKTGDCMTKLATKAAGDAVKAAMPK